MDAYAEQGEERGHDQARTPLPVCTERLRLRAHRAGDEGWLHRLYADPEVARFLLDDPWTEEDANRRLRERLSQVDLDTGAGSLAAVVEYGGEPVGDVLLWLTDRENRTAEIGWVLDPVHGGRGLASEAVRAVLDLAFGRFRLHRVVARMDARNTPSAALASRVGLRREAHHLQDWWSKGEWTDTFVFAALASDRQLP